ncbi:MAG: hypothetical protein K6F14_07530 [Clostridiales bacterium]|nr:hypothetical protein [Clostridiales bacterium]
MKRTVIALILLIGILCLVACQNTEEPPSASGQPVDSSLVGFWRETDGEGYLQIYESGSGFYKGKLFGNREIRCTFYSRGNYLHITSKKDGRSVELRYFVNGETLRLNEIVYVKE